MEPAVVAPAPITDQNVYPLDTPNQPADPEAGGACLPDGWRDQQSGLQLIRFARGYLVFNCAGAAADLILSASESPAFKLFTKGIGQSSTDANAQFFGENLDSTDTNCYDDGALCENNDVFEMQGIECVIQEPVFVANADTTNAVREYPNWLSYYHDRIVRTVLDQVTFDLKFGNGKNIDYELGPLAEWPGSTGPSGTVARNGTSNVTVYTPLRGRLDTGGPNDNDKMRLFVNVPQECQIGSDSAHPTVECAVVVPVKVRIYGSPRSK
jgi:hypothetical protein